MNQTTNSPPFDQGVFLLHFNKGKEALDNREYEMARLELELALRYRPDHEDVLNLLGLLYFKLKRYPQAEEIYQELLKKNPNVFILHSNLGLILFKQGKIEEAIEHLERATNLNPTYTKAHLYLGLAYRRKQKYGLALEHFRHAGAEQLAEEMKKKLATLKPKETPSKETQEVSPKPRDTQPAVDTTQPLPIPEQSPPQPVAEMTLAFSEDTDEITQKIQLPQEKEEKLKPSFILHKNGFLEIHTTRSVIIRQKTLTTYVGNFRFHALPMVAGTTAKTLVQAEGQGKLFLYEKGKHTYLLSLKNEFLYVEGSHLLALEESIKVRSEPSLPLPKASENISIFKVHGQGMVALLAETEPMVLRVTPQYPLTIRINALMAWSGHLLISSLEEVETSGVPREGDSPLVRFEGNGYVVAFHT